MTARINRNDALLVVVDIQGKILPAMYESEKVEACAIKLIQGFKILGAPVIATEQYPEGLGPTTPAVLEALGDSTVIGKRSFSCLGEPKFVETVKALGKKVIVMCGIESHVCVQQTALELKEAGYTVVLVSDAASSRTNENKQCALKRMRMEGVIIENYESVLFDMLDTSLAPEFKQISKLVK